MALLHYMDTILVPLSFFMTFGYHAYLWYQFKTKPSSTTIGMESIKRKHWLKDMRQGDDKNATLAVQSLRNTLMSSILVAMVSSIITVALTALINNTYSVKDLFTNSFFGLHTTKILFLKYGSAYLFLLTSFLCSSMAVANLIDANYLVYALGAEPESDRATSPSPSPSSSRKYTRDILERGFVLAIFGNRMLCVTFPVLFWLVSPVVFVFASLVLVWGLYMLDFVNIASCY
nr:extensin like [Tanacetum cinerariifolium]